jgi:polar amino acid transport system substrate-binding protein
MCRSSPAVTGEPAAFLNATNRPRRQSGRSTYNRRVRSSSNQIRSPFIAVLATGVFGLLVASCSKTSAPATSAETAPKETSVSESPAAESAVAPEAAPTNAAQSSAAADTAPAAAPAGLSPNCAPDKLTLKNAGMLTIGTDKPAYAPWFSNDDPTNGKGFESALSYAIAEQLGFAKDKVKWETVPFNSSYAPGEKSFDFDINQISITDERKQVVDFSDGYYEVNQAIVALNDSPAANAKTMAELTKYKFGAQVGTTSLQFITDVVKPSAQPFVYDDTNAAKAALLAKQIDAIIVDLPTAFYISAAEIENSKVVGQFPSQGGSEQFGLLLEKTSALTGCINEALAALKTSGKLAAIQEAELATATNAPVLK